MKKNPNNSDQEKNKNTSKQLKTSLEKSVFAVKNEIQTDPNGSWTGIPENPNEKPIQDADDL